MSDLTKQILQKRILPTGTQAGTQTDIVNKTTPVQNGYKYLAGYTSALTGTTQKGGYSWGNMWGFGGGYQGLSGMSGYYMGMGSFMQTTSYRPIGREYLFRNVIGKEQYVQNTPGKMWDVWFDHEDGQKTTRTSPLVLDLNGDGKAGITGKNITGNGKIDGETVMFDLDPTRESWEKVSYNLGKHYEKKNAGVWKEIEVNGKKKNVFYYGKKETREKTEWLAKNSGDGFLVWDVDNDGKITSSKELFGNYDIDGAKRFNDGYQKLAHYFDKNKDGVVTGQEIEGLKIWKDANADGITQDGELESLEKYGINAFDVKNINKADMSSTFNQQQMAYRDVIKRQLIGYRDYYMPQTTTFGLYGMMGMDGSMGFYGSPMYNSAMYGMMGMYGYLGNGWYY